MLVLGLHPHLESRVRAVSNCPGLRSLHSQKASPTTREHGADHHSPGDMNLAIPVALEKVLVPDRDGGSGRGVSERPEPACGVGDALGVSCLVEEERHH